MCEILFRGKQFGNKDWEYGNLMLTKPMMSTECLAMIGALDGRVRSVDPETVGQYTGLTDRHVMKIFEGDILAFTNDDGETTPYEVRWSGSGWVVRMAGDEVDDDELDEFFAVHSEIVGNVFDNPELMETWS